jgi:hypothetical protein
MAKQRFSDFSGGITDFRFNTASNYSERMANWLVERDKSMRVRPGFKLWDISANRIPTNLRVSSIKDVADTLCFFSNGRIYYNNAGLFTEITGPTGNKAFNEADALSMVDAAQFGESFILVDDSYSFPMKLFKDENGILNAVNAGLPPILGEPILTPSSDQDNSYIYGFCYEYEYRIGTTLFLDLGEIKYVQVTDAHDSFTGSLDITSFLELTNGATRNYDTVNIRKRIYRTPANGTTLYLVDTIDNNVTSYTDTKNDDDLIAGEVIYTQGGVKDNNLPPQCKYIAVNNNVAYYANVVESAETKPYRLRFSKIADPDSVPNTFFEDFESAITGISAIDDRVVVFTENKAIALEGQLDDLGRGTILRRSIADIGCISNGSIVTTQDYIYWGSTSGIYRTNGIQYEKLTNHLDISYQLITNTDIKKRHIYGTYDNVNQRVYWCINEGSGDNDTFLVYDEINKGFTTMDSGEDFSPSSVISKNQEIIRADSDGYVFVSNETVFSDLIKSNTIPPVDWWTKAIPYEWKHIAWDMGDPERLKWLNKINIVGRPETNVYLEPRVYREGAVDYFAMATIKFNPLIDWGLVSTIWGESGNKWNSVDYLNTSKRFHRRAKRGTHVQLSLASAYTTIQTSSANPDSRVNVDQIANSISLVLPSIYKFGLNYEGYDIIIDGKAYTIISGSESTVIVLDPDNSLVDGVYDYEIKGYPKAQRPQISDIALYFEVFGDMDKLDESEG